MIALWRAGACQRVTRLASVAAMLPLPLVKVALLPVLQYGSDGAPPIAAVMNAVQPLGLLMLLLLSMSAAKHRRAEA